MKNRNLGENWKALDSSDENLVTSLKFSHGGDLIHIKQELNGSKVEAVILTVDEIQEVYSLAKLYRELNKGKEEGIFE